MSLKCKQEANKDDGVQKEEENSQVLSPGMW